MKGPRARLDSGPSGSPVIYYTFGTTAPRESRWPLGVYEPTYIPGTDAKLNKDSASHLVNGLG